MHFLCADNMNLQLHKMNSSMQVSAQQKSFGLPSDVRPQPLHQRGDQSLQGVCLDEAQQDGVPGETLQTGKDGEMSVEVGVRPDLAQSDGGPHLHLVQHVELADLAVWTVDLLLSAVWPVIG